LTDIKIPYHQPIVSTGSLRQISSEGYTRAEREILLESKYLVDRILEVKDTALDANVVAELKLGAEELEARVKSGMEPEEVKAHADRLCNTAYFAVSHRVSRTEGVIDKLANILSRETYDAARAELHKRYWLMSGDYLPVFEAADPSLETFERNLQGGFVGGVQERYRVVQRQYSEASGIAACVRKRIEEQLNYFERLCSLYETGKRVVDENELKKINKILEKVHGNYKKNEEIVELYNEIKDIRANFGKSFKQSSRFSRKAGRWAYVASTLFKRANAHPEKIIAGLDFIKRGLTRTTNYKPTRKIPEPLQSTLRPLLQVA